MIAVLIDCTVVAGSFLATMTVIGRAHRWWYR